MSPIVLCGCEAQWVWPIDGKITAATISQGKQALWTEAGSMNLLQWWQNKQYVVNYFILMG